MTQACPDSRTLAQAFNRCFFASHRVLCLGGAAEPAYLPARDAGGVALLRYMHDHPASVLHEVAHWCLAGTARRAHVDYDLRYQAPPRTAQARQAFFRAELPVQALECWFARAAGLTFEVSVDDFDCPAAERAAFAGQVAAAHAALACADLCREAKVYTCALQALSAARG